MGIALTHLDRAGTKRLVRATGYKNQTIGLDRAEVSILCIYTDPTCDDDGSSFPFREVRHRSMNQLNGSRINYVTKAG